MTFLQSIDSEYKQTLSVKKKKREIIKNKKVARSVKIH